MAPGSKMPRVTNFLTLPTASFPGQGKSDSRLVPSGDIRGVNLLPTRWLRDLSELPGEASQPEMLVKAMQRSLPAQALDKAGDSEGL